MEYKNKKFNLFGETWKISYKENPIPPRTEADANSFYFGYTDYGEHTVYINILDSNGKPATKETLDNTLRHELMHVVFGSGQYLGSTQDEPLVEWTARCLGALIRQNVFH